LTQLRALVADLAAGVRTSHITDEVTLTPAAESGTPQRSPGLVGT
jgi:hypothetical protein